MRDHVRVHSERDRCSQTGETGLLSAVGSGSSPTSGSSRRAGQWASGWSAASRTQVTGAVSAQSQARLPTGRRRPAAADAVRRCRHSSPRLPTPSAAHRARPRASAIRAPQPHRVGSRPGTTGKGVGRPGLAGPPGSGGGAHGAFCLPSPGPLGPARSPPRCSDGRVGQHVWAMCPSPWAPDPW